MWRMAGEWLVSESFGPTSSQPEPRPP
jgi:hypothetical protein